MHIKYKGFECECGGKIVPDFGELHFELIDGEIVDGFDKKFVCGKCGAVYTLWDMEFIPTFLRLDKKDENGLSTIVKPIDGVYREINYE